MMELMTKQDAIEYLLYLKHDVQAGSPVDVAIDTAIEVLKQPTIEPEVRHGRWIPIDGEPYAKCSYCGEKHYGCTTPYCDMCGAYMR